MTDNIIILGMGVLIVVLGILNCLGHFESIHWYNRRKITEETRKPYGKAVGIGTIIIGVSMLVCAALEWILKTELIYFGLLAGCVVGVAFIMYAQFKYNKGIF